MAFFVERYDYPTLILIPKDIINLSSSQTIFYPQNHKNIITKKQLFFIIA